MARRAEPRAVTRAIPPEQRVMTQLIDEWWLHQDQMYLQGSQRTVHFESVRNEMAMAACKQADMGKCPHWFMYVAVYLCDMRVWRVADMPLLSYREVLNWQGVDTQAAILEYNAWVMDESAKATWAPDPTEEVTPFDEQLTRHVYHIETPRQPNPDDMRQRSGLWRKS